MGLILDQHPVFAARALYPQPCSFSQPSTGDFRMFFTLLSAMSNNFDVTFRKPLTVNGVRLFSAFRQAVFMASFHSRARSLSGSLASSSGVNCLALVVVSAAPLDLGAR